MKIRLLGIVCAVALLVGLCAATIGSADAVPSPGDVNGDSSVDMKDVLSLRLYLVNPAQYDYAMTALDCNGDGEADMKDVLFLRRYLAHLEEHLGGESAPESSAEPTESTTKRTQPTWPTKQPIDSAAPRINFIKDSKATLGVWWWMTADGRNETTREQYLDFLEENEVTEIYYYGFTQMANAPLREGLHTFVQAAMKHGFRVALLFDNQAVVKEGNTSFIGAVEQLRTYLGEYPEDAIYGIHCDIEPQATARASREATAQWMRDYTNNFLVAQVAPARAEGVVVELDIGCGWWYYGKEIPYTGSATHEYDGTVMNLNDIMAYNCDCMCLMSYRDTAKEILDMGQAQRQAADRAGTKIVYGVETGDDGEGAHVDFSADSKEIMYTELSRLFVHLESDPSVGEYGFAIHHTRPWYNLRDTM